MPNYGDIKYWDNRYRFTSGQTYDWLEDYETLKPHISKHLRPEFRILVLGCGNARFSEDMYNDGFHNIFNNDISAVVIS